MAIKRKEAAKSKKQQVVDKTNTGQKERTTTQNANVKAKPSKQPITKNKDYSNFIEELAVLEVPIKPNEAVRRILEKFPRSLNAELPTDDKLHASFVYQKGKRAKKVM